jgi:hypothetical protein
MYALFICDYKIRPLALKLTVLYHQTYGSCFRTLSRRLTTTARLFSHAHQEVERDRFKKFFIYKLKKNKKVEFHFDPKEHSLKVSANSVEGSGYGY